MADQTIDESGHFAARAAAKGDTGRSTTREAPTTTGLVLGKFMPPHVGHLHLVDFARVYCDELHVVVGTLAHEPIDGRLRHAWMTELAPFANVLHLNEELPQDPSEHPHFWDLWRSALQRVLPTGRLDFVFASEPYGLKLAEVLGATFVPVDIARAGVSISATAIRDDPMKHWDLLPRCVRAHFVKRVCIFGPESTGKSTLAGDLARHFSTVAVPEHARVVLETFPPDEARPMDHATLARIARGQIASEEALARSANRVLFCDTDATTTTIWSEVLLGSVDRALIDLAKRDRYDLTLLTDVDIPWVADPIRFRPDDRAAFLDRCERALTSAGRSFVKISGTSREARCDRATRVVRERLFETSG